MHDDNPLWYDHVEPGEEPGPILSALAAIVLGFAAVSTAVKHVYRLPDRLWVAAFGEGRSKGR